MTVCDKIKLYLAIFEIDLYFFYKHEIKMFGKGTHVENQNQVKKMFHFLIVFTVYDVPPGDHGEIERWQCNQADKTQITESIF